MIATKHETGTRALGSLVGVTTAGEADAAIPSMAAPEADANMSELGFFTPNAGGVAATGGDKGAAAGAGTRALARGDWCVGILSTEHNVEAGIGDPTGGDADTDGA